MTVQVPCKPCLGDGCDVCLHKGMVQGFCACAMPADLLCSEVTPLCFACASICILCEQEAAADDRVCFDGSGFAHFACAVEFAADARRFLEAPGNRGDSGVRVEVMAALATTGGPPRKRASRRSEMPKVSLRNAELMRKRGLLAIVECARLTGLTKGNFYNRIRKNKLGPPVPLGPFLFLPVDGLALAYPHVLTDLVKSSPDLLEHITTPALLDRLKEIRATAQGKAA